MFATGTSAVGARYNSSSRSRYMSSSNFGNWPVPIIALRLIRNGGNTSVYPCSRVCRSSSKLISARSSRAPAPLYKNEPAAGNLRRAREIQDAQFLADLPMRFRRKRELRRLTPTPHFGIVGRILARPARIRAADWESSAGGSAAMHRRRPRRDRAPRCGRRPVFIAAICASAFCPFDLSCADFLTDLVALAL